MNALTSQEYDNTAPIALFVYKRADHTLRTLKALQENALAEQSDLYIFSDGPKSQDDIEGVQAVRKLISTVEGFASVTVQAREQNIGLAQSIISGVTEVVNQHGRVIVIEDDLVTHSSTLTYFNRMLQYYEHYAGVFSISSYHHPEELMSIPEGYEFDVYAIPRMQCWGWATWKDRWEKADFSVPDFDAFNQSSGDIAAYAHWIGGDSLGTLRSCMKGEKDVWACRWVYTHFKHHAVCICPTHSLVNNIGFDGSGSNCGVSKQNDQRLTTSDVNTWRLPVTAHVDPRIYERFMRVMDKNRQRNRISADQEKIQQINKTKQEPVVVTQVERIKYWASHPIKLLRQIKQVVFSKNNNQVSSGKQQSEVTKPVPVSDKQAVKDAHDQLSANPKGEMVRLGTEYGGWWVPTSGLGPDDFIVSAGAGEDISFDVEVAKRFGCKVLIMDPTPRAVAHFNNTVSAIETGNPAPINHSDKEFYQASATDMSCLKFQPYGLWNENTHMRFFVPANPKHVSHSIGNMHAMEEGFDAECITLAEALHREGRAEISVLKIDIEGAEFEVLADMIKSGLWPKYILAEFHAGQDETERRLRTRTIQTLTDLYQHGYRLVKQNGWDYVLERQ